MPAAQRAAAVVFDGGMLSGLSRYLSKESLLLSFATKMSHRQLALQLISQPLALVRIGDEDPGSHGGE